jgi:hypothetical protein
MSAYPVKSILLASLLLPASFSTTALGQGLRVSTHVYDVAAEEATGRQVAIAGSLSLFHHGKVYDYVDSADEVVILDLANRRFTILNTARQLATTLNFDEMRHLLDSREPATEQYIADLVRTNRPNAQRIAEFVRFQLRPEFSANYDDTTGNLSLTSPSWTYVVKTTEWKDPEIVEQYVDYADWMARLNHLLHPGALFPEPRIELNKSLRELKQLPLTVELDLRPTEQLRLRAEHRFTAGLREDDHRRVAKWEAALASESIKQLSFRRYQQTVLVASKH